MPTPSPGAAAANIPPPLSIPAPDSDLTHRRKPLPPCEAVFECEGGTQERCTGRAGHESNHETWVRVCWPKEAT